MSSPVWSDDQRNELGFMEQELELAWKETTGQVSEVSRPKIQTVPEYMAARVEFEKFYRPQLIAIGPVRYNSDHQMWKLGESYKCKWTAMYLNHTKQTIEDLYIRISTHERKVFEQFTVEYYINELRPFILDGCSILQVLEKSYNSVNADQELKISIDKLVQVHQDLLILDNQFPFQALRLLCNDDTSFKKGLQNFLEIHGLKLIVDIEDPVHLLDYLRRALLMRDLGQIPGEMKFERKNLHLGKYRIGTIREGSRDSREKDRNNTAFYPSFSDTDGILYLPELTVDGSTALIFLNLIAYEMCPDFRNDLEITSYVVFMSSLIDQPEDVKELRSARILVNQLANDKQVADLFNKMDSLLVPETSRFAKITDGIDKHFDSKRNKIKMLRWMEEAYETFLRSPWTIIALLAGSLGLVLTFIQTWFAIHPKGK